MRGLLAALIGTLPMALTAHAAAAADAGDPHAGHAHHHGGDAQDAHAGHAGHAAHSAPIGVMGDHVHSKGEWMISYRYMHMEMNQNYDGSDQVSPDDIRMPGGPYMVAPTDMAMDMHMFGLMYAPLDHVTLMAMIPFITKSMDHVAMSGAEFTTASKGVGDLKLSALVKVLDGDHHVAHLTVGFSSPTGSIDATGDTPAGPDSPLPYPMQIGSGTFDLLFGATYSGHRGRVSWGSQASAIIRLGENDRDYRFGHQYQITGWGTVRFIDAVGASFRLAWNQNFDIDGADPALNPMMVPTADPKLRAGRRLDALFGLDFTPGALGDRFDVVEGVRIAIEGGLPAYQNLDGPQLGESWQITTGIQYAF
jgi:hypothetical protein